MIKPVRVLVVLENGGITGAAIGLAGILKALPRSEAAVTVARLPARGRTTALERLIRRRKIEVVQSASPSAGGLAAAWQANLPHLWYLSSVEMLRPDGSERIPLSTLTLIGQLSAGIIVSSKGMKRLLPAALQRKSRVIPNSGVDPAAMPARKPDWLKRKLRLRDETPLVGMIGNFYPAKRHADFLKAARMIRRRRPDCRFLIAGLPAGATPAARKISARYRRKIDGMIRTLGLTGRVTLTRYRPAERFRWIGGLDLLLAPAWESLGQGLLEGAACGVPIISANVGGAKELFSNGKSARLVPFGRPDRIAEAALALLQNPKQAEALARQARTRISRRFSASAQAKRLAALYRTLAARRHSTGPSSRTA